MLEIKFVRENLDIVKKRTTSRNIKLNWHYLKKNESKRRELLHSIESLRHQQNIFSNKIAKMKKNNEEVNELILKMKEVSNQIKLLKEKLNKSEDILKKFIISIPNLPHESVPEGFNKNNNDIIKKISKPKAFNFEPLPHWIIGKNLNLLDFKRASKISGSRFPLLTGLGAKMERALINFMLDTHIEKHGYYEIFPPLIVNRESLFGSGQLPKFEEDLFKIENQESFLIPTAEVPLINIHKDEILEKSDLPILYVAYSPCFRAEAGSYGKDIKGLIRQHQFNKIELIKFSLPKNSYMELEKLLQDAEKILQLLKLPYRVINLCTGDLGFSASKTYDIEVWMPSQKKYIEISSCSNSEDFQARRCNIRFKNKNKKGTRLVHILNASGLAVGRTMAAILENYQENDGSVVVPEILRSYMGGIEKIK